MKNTLTRTLALMMALLLALSVCAFADEADVTATMPGETVETVESTDDLIDDVDETPAEAEGELEEEPVEVEEELVVEGAPEIVTDEAMDVQVSIPVEIGGWSITGETDPGTVINYSETLKDYPGNPIKQGDVTLTIEGEGKYTLTLNDAVIDATNNTGIDGGSSVEKLTINLIGSNSITVQNYYCYGIYATNALEIKGDADSSLTIKSEGIGISTNSSLTVSGGKVTVEAAGANQNTSYGIHCMGQLILTGGELTATGGAVKGGGLSLGVALGKEETQQLPPNKTRHYFPNGNLKADGMVIRSGADAASSVEMDAERYLALLEKQEYTVVFHEAREAEPTSLKYFHAEPKKEAEPTPPPAPTAPTSAPAPEADGLIVASMKTAGKTGFKFTWTPIAGAEGYDVFLGDCGDKSCDVVATAAGSARSITVRRLKKYTAYKGYVRAWQMVNGQKTYITAASPLMHAITGGNTNKYTNPKKITVKKARFTLKPGKTAKIKASVKKLENSKKLLDHEQRVRYYSSNPAVATVNAKGKITAVAAGTCKIYVIAVNGLRKAVTVKVKQK